MKKIGIRFYEGLFSYNSNKVMELQCNLATGELKKIRKPLWGSHLASVLMNDIVSRYWSSDNTKVSSLALWGSPWNSKYQITEKYNIVIGHSYGAYRALKMAEKASHEIDLLVLFDCRWIRGNHFFKKPSNVKKCLNFYQTGLLRGYTVDGAINQAVSNVHHGSIDDDLDSIARVLNEIYGG